ncbi:hypothetical protein AAFF_G00321070 [Aldrovandia affinis]|uniref:Uncharacterized protein n=1 Tax=Aldrovandia affinis TaxID=143900 RepID=A0AAD7W0B7_9TELE|nr:hypothetical protein AAFF_G00321070 [Aldrovandia affinis]
MDINCRHRNTVLFIVTVTILSLVQSQNEDPDRRLFGAPGSLVHLSVSDPGLQKVVRFAEGRYNVGSNGIYLRRVTKIVSASKQVVKGVKYSIMVELGNTLCKKSAVLADPAVCEFHTDPNKLKTEVCLFEIWDIPWQSKSTVLKQKCQPAASFKESNRIEALPLSPSTPDKTQESVDLLSAFKEFVIKYNRSYSGQEEADKRLQIFQENLRTAQILQSLDQGSAEYGVTKFSDLTEEEFPCGPRTQPCSQQLGLERARSCQPSQKPGHVWIMLGLLSDREHRGSVVFEKGNLLSLSEQELVDCDRLDQACGGGLPSNAYEAIEKLGGLETETDYTYTGHKQSCDFSTGKVAAYINSSVELSKDENEIAAWLAENGPVSVALNAFAMQFYRKGVSHPLKIFCNPWMIDHAVLLVGYGDRNGIPFWAIKNSWGEDYGEEGYYYLYRGSRMCGINKMCSSAVVN